MDSYMNPIAWPFYELWAPTPRCHRPQRLLLAANREQRPSAEISLHLSEKGPRVGGICYQDHIRRRRAGQAQSSNRRRRRKMGQRWNNPSQWWAMRRINNGALPLG